METLCNFSCPIVGMYPEAINASCEFLHEDRMDYMHPALPIDDPKAMERRLFEELGAKFDISRSEISVALSKAYDAQRNWKMEVQRKGEEALALIEEQGLHGIVLAGRPYHVDPEVNHGIPAMIQGFGYPVLSEDSISHLREEDGPLRVRNQWTYHKRLYRAATYVSRREDLDLVQLCSFGCGVDATTSDQCSDILSRLGKIFTQLKIDEISNLGAVRIRMRSLFAAIEERKRYSIRPAVLAPMPLRNVFTKEMADKYTLLFPQMSPFHFDFFAPAFRNMGINMHLLPTVTKADVEEGLVSVHNDMCYPAVIVIGQLLKALRSGEFDPKRTALVLSQTGGGCRASQYVAALRRALREQGLDHVPVVSFSVQKLEKNPGFNISMLDLRRICAGLILGDVIMRCVLRTRPYEVVPGSSNAIHAKYLPIAQDLIADSKYRKLRAMAQKMITEFDTLELAGARRPRVGIVGEILVKYHPYANNNVIDVLEQEGAEVVCPDILDFFSYCGASGVINRDMLGTSLGEYIMSKATLAVMEAWRKPYCKMLDASERFHAPHSIYSTMECAEEVDMSLSCQSGEGWFLTGEIVQLIREDVPNVLILSPFGCLPNHVTGKAAVPLVKRKYPQANITAIDYDPGATEVNQLSRIKLMLASAFRRHSTQTGQSTRVVADVSSLVLEPLEEPIPVAVLADAVQEVEIAAPEIEVEDIAAGKRISAGVVTRAMAMEE